MKRFFKSYESISHFTRSLDCHQDQLECSFCSKHDQFVSHGIIYKQHTMKPKEPVGKRIFCSNRYGRSGCGRTFQLYVSSEIPNLHYGAVHLVAFISALVSHSSVSEAYYQTTGTYEYRNAWRWLNKLTRKLSEFRRFLQFKTTTLSSMFSDRCRSLQLLLPSLFDTFSLFPTCPCSGYQLQRQSVFI